MRAGDSWEDLHGTKDRPQREVSKARAEKLAELAAAHGVAPADVAAAIDWREAAAGPSSDGAGPSSDGDVDVDIEQPAVDPKMRQRGLRRRLELGGQGREGVKVRALE